MTDDAPKPSLRYLPPDPAPEGRPWALVLWAGTADEERFPFYGRLEIGRDDGQAETPGTILVRDRRVSRRHCVIGERRDGSCFVRDVSRNGTRLDGRRLVPNIEWDLCPGQRLLITPELEFLVEGEEAPVADDDVTATEVMVGKAHATLLVGDIRDYTGLVRHVPSADLQQSVSRVFQALNVLVGEHGGTVKEYQGDALVAFWEGDFMGRQVPKACRAALALDAAVQRLAADRRVWALDGFPLEMDWALATGTVAIDTFGGSRPTGLSMIGEPIVLAFRLEKFAGEKLGRILACPLTRQLAGGGFRFRDLGEMTAKGFDRPDRVYALEGESPADGPGGPGEVRT